MIFFVCLLSNQVGFVINIHLNPGFSDTFLSLFILDRYSFINSARISASVNAMRVLNTGTEVEAAVADALVCTLLLELKCLLHFGDSVDLKLTLFCTFIPQLLSYMPQNVIISSIFTLHQPSVY